MRRLIAITVLSLALVAAADTARALTVAGPGFAVSLPVYATVGPPPVYVAPAYVPPPAVYVPPPVYVGPAYVPPPVWAAPRPRPVAWVAPVPIGPRPVVAPVPVGPRPGFAPVPMGPRPR
ncbi:hypothetical protein [Solidesulfovibrio sp.]|jgi:hypothetical protein|uniref:hypothetical protein n=1 Tax=Solidesulfovibrio sp. TaxID=2910990 RepID=UPI002B1F6D01|nr:hypothetical protein [Solidesulfovibrio sp.]MEA5088897.1 hypothetical protein [Solidesulfovibrio sp.]